MKKLKRPYADLLPPLSTAEFDALKASIEAEGVRDPVILDEVGNVLDGHHRLKIKPDAPTRMIKGLSEAEKMAFVFQSNFTRRNLSPDQKKEKMAATKKVAFALREEDAKKNTQKRVAAMLGVARSTVESWFIPPKDGVSDDSAVIACTPNASIRIPPKETLAIAERVDAGEKPAQVAADYGVSRQRINQIVAKEVKAEQAERERKAAARKAKAAIKETSGNGIYFGDSFKLAESIPDATCPLIFTDPPYDRKSLPMFEQLGELAGRILVDGGSLITYCGQYVMSDVMDLILSEGRLRWFWLTCCLHTGGTAQMKEYGIKVKWKPMLWFVKGDFRRDRTIWVDDLIKSNQEKDAHVWQHSLIEASYYINKLSKPDELVLDPFCGGGTTAVAAKQLKRQWWTADVDSKCVDDARKRINVK